MDIRYLQYSASLLQITTMPHGLIFMDLMNVSAKSQSPFEASKTCAKIDLFEIDCRTKYDDCVVVYEKRKQLKRLSKDLLVVLLHFTQDCESETRTSGMKILQQYYCSNSKGLYYVLRPQSQGALPSMQKKAAAENGLLLYSTIYSTRNSNVAKKRKLLRCYKKVVAPGNESH